MNRRFNKINDADKLFYYFFSENESCNLMLRLMLRLRIDKSVLKKALNKTLERYPNFRQTPVMDARGYLYTMDNDREAEVYAYDPEPVILGTKDTNGYLFRVMYEGNCLWISVFHAVCDGRGYMMFVRTLLYNYFTFSGCSIRNEGEHILTGEVPADHSEMSDPFDIHLDGEPGSNPFKPTGDESIFVLPDTIKGTDECRHYGLFRYVLDTKKLRQLARETETTVDTYFHLLMAKVIHDSYDTGDKMITGMGAVDLRPYYNSRYLQNMRELFWIYYPGDFFDLPDRHAADLIQRLFKKQQLSRDNFDSILLESKAGLKEMLGFPFSNEKGQRLLRERVWTAPELLVTYFTTNLVSLELGEDIDAFVEQADMYGPAIFRCPGVFLLTQGNKTTVNLTQRSFSRYLPLKLREAFIKKGLLLSEEMGCSFENDKIRTGMIPVV